MSCLLPYRQFLPHYHHLPVPHAALGQPSVEAFEGGLAGQQQVAVAVALLVRGLGEGVGREDDAHRVVLHGLRGGEV